MSSYLESINKQFEYYKLLGDKTFEQLSDKDIHWQFNSESNSVAIIVKHMVGNMLSRWTNFLTEDGEKEWRHRDTEFEDPYTTKEDMLEAWEKGWHCLFDAITPLTENDLERIKNYCQKDVIAVAQLYLKFRGLKMLKDDEIEYI